MAMYFVLHGRKIKTMAGCVEVIKHNLRKKDNLEAFVDVGKSKENFYSGATDENFLVQYEELTANLSRKIQRNASRSIEFVFSFSHKYGEGWEDDPELKEKITQYFDAAEKFLKDRYGDVIICRCDHFDEKTPHSHFLLVPICLTKDGKRKFSSSQFLGGRKGLFELHDKFHQEVGAHFGLERGIRESRASHSDLKNYAEWEESQRIILKQKEADLNEQAALLQRQQKKIEENEKKLKAQRQQLFLLTGNAMEKSADISDRELENDEIEKMHVEQIPEITIPPATLVEKTRKKWRDGIQGMVNSAFKKVISVMLSYKIKYDGLLEKYQTLKVSNEQNRQCAEKAQKDLIEKPIEEILVLRQRRTNPAPVRQQTNGVGGKTR